MPFYIRCKTRSTADARYDLARIMIPLAVLLNSIPPGSRDLLEFGFFMAVGITAGSLGLI